MSRAKNIAGIVASALGVLPLAASAIPKLFLAKPGTEFYTNFEKMGFHEILVPLGIIDLLLAVLVFMPRTALIGIIAAFAYWAAALATEITHGQFNPAPMVGMILLVVSAWIRTPEAFDRLLGRRAA
jgi:hypothetical protein